MISAIVSMVIGGVLKLIPGLADSVFRHIERKADTETERERIRTVAATHLMAEQAATIRTAMNFKIFWVPWSMIAIPFGAWLGWGFLDSLFNGALPDVAELPPQLKEYGDIVMANLFVSGGVVAGVQGGARAISNAVAGRIIRPNQEPAAARPEKRQRYPGQR